MEKKPTLLLILDGFGLAEASPGNAITQATIPTLKRLLALSEGTSLEASGLSVGLPKGFIGNSEVGHLNIGAGRVVYQDLTRIDLALENDSLGSNPIFQELCRKVRLSKGRLHFLGLLSDAGVHSHTSHLKALIKAADQGGVQSLVHAFMDGRDSSPTSGASYVHSLAPFLARHQGKLASLCGRYFAMDRDARWDRVEKAWNMLCHGQGQDLSATDAEIYLNEAYARNETDEFIQPSLFLPPTDACIRDGDGVFFFNFRADRCRQMVHVFTDEKFEPFNRGAVPHLADLATMTSYEATLQVPVMFTKDNLGNTMGEVVSQMGLNQLRIAETEKYAHVTYFFNGGRETPFANEDRILIESPKEVATYDLKPSMSAPQVTEKLLEAINSGKYQFIVCNFANPDMVGHTGVLEAAIKACETVDACVEKVEKAILKAGGCLFITADHGNVEKMVDADGSPYTAHTTNRTPFIALNAQGPIALVPEGGRLCDIVPTILQNWGVPQPAEMSGRSLLA